MRQKEQRHRGCTLACASLRNTRVVCSFSCASMSQIFSSPPILPSCRQFTYCETYAFRSSIACNKWQIQLLDSSIAGTKNKKKHPHAKVSLFAHQMEVKSRSLPSQTGAS